MRVKGEKGNCWTENCKRRSNSKIILDAIYPKSVLEANYPKNLLAALYLNSV